MLGIWGGGAMTMTTLGIVDDAERRGAPIRDAVISGYAFPDFSASARQRPGTPSQALNGDSTESGKSARRRPGDLVAVRPAWHGHQEAGWREEFCRSADGLTHELKS